MPVRGSFRALFLHDVAEAIRLEELRSILGADRAARAPSFAHPTPDYVRFEQPPVSDLTRTHTAREWRAIGSHGEVLRLRNHKH